MSISGERKLTAIRILWFATTCAFAQSAQASSNPTSIFSPISTPAQSIYGLSFFILALIGAVFVVVFSLLTYAVIRFRERVHEGKHEPPQVYGSTQAETAWTVISILIVVALFQATGRGIANVQDAAKPHDAIEVTVIGHQLWWEYRYPGLNVVTWNELYVPVSNPAHPTPWPSIARCNRSAIPFYLFLATIPCDALSAFLPFCGRVLYRAYDTTPSLFSSLALGDQELAGATIWVWVTFAYLVPAVVITIQILSPATTPWRTLVRASGTHWRRLNGGEPEKSRAWRANL